MVLQPNIIHLWKCITHCTCKTWHNYIYTPINMYTHTNARYTRTNCHIGNAKHIGKHLLLMVAFHRSTHTHTHAYLCVRTQATSSAHPWLIWKSPHTHSFPLVFSHIPTNDSQRTDYSLIVYDIENESLILSLLLYSFPFNSFLSFPIYKSLFFAF